jgi:hypothetical protein
MRIALAAVALLGLAACTTPPPAAAPEVCAAPLKPALQVELYFGRTMDKGRMVSEAEWAGFLAEEVTPRFPAGLSVADVEGQWQGPSGRIGRERSKLLIVVVFDAPSHGSKVQAIVDTYKQRFLQQSVLRVERTVCASA